MCTIILHSCFSSSNFSVGIFLSDKQNTKCDTYSIHFQLEYCVPCKGVTELTPCFFNPLTKIGLDWLTPVPLCAFTGNSIRLPNFFFCKRRYLSRFYRVLVYNKTGKEEKNKIICLKKICLKCLTFPNACKVDKYKGSFFLKKNKYKEFTTLSTNLVFFYNIEWCD